MKLSTAQQDFTLVISHLIQFAYKKGYRLTFGDAYRDPRVHGVMGERKSYGHPSSCHKLRLAVDFNVFRDGSYLINDKADDAYNELHDYWDTIGGAKRIPHDLNHFSFEWNGYR